MPWTTQGAADFVALLLNAVALDSAYDGTLYVSAHTSAPGASGSQSTNEISYTGYSRFAIDRAIGGWTVTDNAAETDVLIDWGTYASGAGGTITHWGLGTEPSGTGRLILWGEVSPSLVVSQAPHRPAIPANDLTITLPTASGEITADDVWQPLTVMAVTNPMDHGAVGDGEADDGTALFDAADALPSAGGIVFLPPDKTFLKADVLTIPGDHVKLWSPTSGYDAERPASILATNASAGGKTAIKWVGRAGGGAFGVKFVCDATERSEEGTYEDMGFVYLNCSDVETVGCELQKVGAASVNINQCTRAQQEGNLFVDTFADSIFHAYGGTQYSYNWRNCGIRIGDDMVSVVTDLGETQTDIETWLNTVVDGLARGYTVVGGGPRILIHRNWAVGLGAAGILVGSEESFDTETANGVDYFENNIYGCCVIITSHTGVLITGGNPDADPVSNVAGTNNRSVNSGAGAYRTEGDIGSNVTSTGLGTTVGDLPSPIPTDTDITLDDTTVLRTRDTSHAGDPEGLYRIHVRGTPGAFQQRFEWVVQGDASDVAAHLAARAAAGDRVSLSIDIGGTQYAVYLSGATHSLGTGVSAVTIAELRTLDRAGGAGSTLWNLIDSGDY